MVLYVIALAVDGFVDVTTQLHLLKWLLIKMTFAFLGFLQCLARKEAVERNSSEVNFG